MRIPLTEDLPGLLVSVRDPEEVDAAIEGGANWIDVKEPNRGSLGAANPHVMFEVIGRVAGRVPVSVAAGELLDGDCNQTVADLAGDGVTAIKFGLAGCASVPNWRSRWNDLIVQICGDISPIAVAYADWTYCDAPSPEQVLQAAVGLRCSALLIDTHDKSAGDLFDFLSISRLRRILVHVGQAGMATALAGSLQGPAFRRAALLKPDFVAVRTAACGGFRQGRVSLDQVARLSNQLHEIRRRSARTAASGVVKDTS